ncbi:hypothetical protein DYB25_013230 [Aphanomyces astaci]|uniref:Protein kinase domain-containing protein n=3 Tax=Aphanomyces astaci TaxID=112090 RepID=A0A397EB68_APHAT|nr:hypothetical protein DYB36_011472 [Aphanomyces astaci]RHY28592.1 hypothetical protein DYB25_013230 [Aphanomyces astaci]RHY74185.1 hypothetical protein DYB34_013656 [Aphanomyces astaci]RHY75684.1 hypothetical protein DYB38_013773 [Aphanomyces astaci]RHY78767.1 hypothetical protein DYB31_014600 [Aphanomyces astaci]
MTISKNADGVMCGWRPFSVLIDGGELASMLKDKNEEKKPASITVMRMLWSSTVRLRTLLNSEGAKAVTLNNLQRFYAMDPMLRIQHSTHFGREFKPNEGYIHVLVIFPEDVRPRKQQRLEKAVADVKRLQKAVAMGEHLVKAWHDLHSSVDHKLDFYRVAPVAIPSCCEDVHDDTAECRHKFVVDVFKVLKWVDAIQKPYMMMHLLPQVRTKTSNAHYVTWLKKCLLKEFGEGAAIDMAVVERIYNAPLEHVDALGEFQSKRDLIIDQVKQALEQLHSLGVAHYDVRVANVFVLLSDKRVILGDLEYCRPVDAALPNIQGAPMNNQFKTAQKLDEHQFERFKDELANV